MSNYLGKLHETVTKFPCTDIWMDSCGKEELTYGIAHGCTGATSNPIIVAAVVRKELPYWEPCIQKIIEENPSFSEDDVVWELIDEVGRQRSPLLLPVFVQYKGKKGRLSIQTNAKNYRNTQKMIDQALHLNSLGKNMQIKIPASAAGIPAMEEATYRGISVNATVSFTVAQAVAVAKAIERGLNRRKAEGLSSEEMSPVCTLMTGRGDDGIKQYVAEHDIIVEPECLEWCGVAIVKEAYRIYKERGYTTRILTAANRNYYHWSEFIGGDILQTINFKWQKMLESCDIVVDDRMGIPVRPEYLERLKTIPEFVKGFDENGQTTEEFEQYGAFRDTLNTFIAGYDEFVTLIRGYMV